MSNIDRTIEEFMTSLATDHNVPVYVQQEASAFIEEMEAKDSRRMKNRMKKVATKVDSKIPRVKVYLPDTNEE